MSEHYGNFKVYGTVISNSVSGGEARYNEIYIDGLKLDPAVINVSGGEYLPMDINSGLTSNFTIPTKGREIYVGFNTQVGKFTCYLNSDPFEGDKVYIVDENMYAYTNNITIDGNGNNINCCATYLLNYNNAGVVFIFAGGQWRAIRN